MNAHGRSFTVSRVQKEICANFSLDEANDFINGFNHIDVTSPFSSPVSSSATGFYRLIA
jgi:hypothetical protein